VKKVFSGGTYDFFADSLKLYGSQVQSCHVTSSGMKCNGCDYTRVSGETAAPRAFSPPSHSDVFGPEPPSGRLQSIEGQYSGFLHHEYLGRYQRVLFHILSKPAASGALEISAVGALFFGSPEDAESIPYAFERQTVPALGSAPLLLWRQDGAHDAILQMTSVGDGEIRGTWYSALFGRVGRFLLRRGQPLRLPEGARVFEPLNARYVWSTMGIRRPLDFDVFIPVIRKESPIRGFDPLRPLFMDGYYTSRQGIVPRIFIPGGSFDFYTGRISIGDVFVGERDSRERMTLTTVAQNIATALGPSRPEPVPYLGPGSSR